MSIVRLDDRDEWQEVRGHNGQVWELNMRTGETRIPALADDLTPEMREAEALLPAMQQASITTPDGRRITPHQWLTEQGLKTDVQSLVTIRTFAREAAAIRNEGRPGAFLWTNIDNWQTDLQTGKAFRTVRDASISEITTINEGRRTLLMHIADAMAEGTKFDLEEAQLTREDLRTARREKTLRERWVFDQEHSDAAYAHRREQERLETQGRIEVEKIKAKAEVESIVQQRAQVYSLQQSVLNRLPEMNRVIDELQFLHDNNPNTAVMQKLALVRDLARAANDLTDLDETKRAQAETTFLKHNINAILSDAMNMIDHAKSQTLQQRRKRPDMGKRIPKKEDDA